MSHRTINRISNRFNHRRREYALGLGASLLVLLALMYAASIATASAPLGL